MRPTSRARAWWWTAATLRSDQYRDFKCTQYVVISLNRGSEGTAQSSMGAAGRSLAGRPALPAAPSRQSAVQRWHYVVPCGQLPSVTVARTARATGLALALEKKGVGLVTECCERCLAVVTPSGAAISTAPAQQHSEACARGSWLHRLCNNGGTGGLSQLSHGHHCPVGQRPPRLLARGRVQGCSAWLVTAQLTSLRAAVCSIAQYRRRCLCAKHGECGQRQHSG
jgi:hypothetical protein